MTMTAPFKAAWRNRSGRRAAVLVELTLNAVAGGTATLYLSSREIQTPAGTGRAQQLWQKGISSAGPLHAPGSLGTSDVALATCPLQIENKTFGLSTGANVSIATLLKDYRWIGSTFTVRIWEESLTTFDDAFPYGPLSIAALDLDDMVVNLMGRQRTDANKPVVPPIVTRDAYPNALEASLGMPLPTVYGAIYPPTLTVPPYTAAYNDVELARELIWGGRRVAKGVLVDVGRGGTGSKARVVVASHAVKALGVPAAAPFGTSAYMAENGRLSLADPAIATDIFNNATDGAGWTMPDDFNRVWAPVYPVDVVTGLLAQMPRAVLDPFSLSYARVDQTNKKIEFQLPAVGDLGPAYTCEVWVIYRTSAGAAALFAILRNPSVGAGQSNYALAASVPIVRVTGTVGTGVPGAEMWNTGFLPRSNWQFSECILGVEFQGGSAGTADIYAIGLTVKHKPNRVKLEPDRIVTVGNPQRRTARDWFRMNPEPSPTSDTLLPGVTELQGDFYANVAGYADNGSGTFTGVAAALIERPCDIMKHILYTYGGQALAQIETGASVHGSFTDARAKLKNWHQADMTLGFSIAQATSVYDLLSRLGRQSACWPFISHLDDKWKLVVWNPKAVATYDLTFTREHFAQPLGPRLSMSPLTDLLTAIRLPYGPDAFKGGYAHESSIGQGKSLSGYEFGNMRDQAFVVTTGVNDKIDCYSTVGGAQTATIAAGNYDTQGAIGAVLDALVAALATGVSVGCGGTVKAGKNAKFYYNDGADKDVSLAAGTFTMAERAAELQGLLGAGYTVTYVVGGFNLTKSAGTFQLKFATKQDSCAALFGFSATDHTGALTYFSDAGVSEELFVIAGQAAGFEIRWRTGTNGWAQTTIKTAAQVLGYLPFDDSVGARVYTGFCPKGEREATLAATASRYGERRELTVEGDAIYSAETAREVRNRIVDLMVAPRVQLENFSTDMAPDLERGQVVNFSSDVDAWRGYPDPGSDGSWAAKRVIVLELQQDFGPISFATTMHGVSLG